MKKPDTPQTEELLKERNELLRLVEQNQQQILLAQQRVAFLNGVLTERGVDLNQAPEVNPTPPQPTSHKNG